MLCSTAKSATVETTSTSTVGTVTIAAESATASVAGKVESVTVAETAKSATVETKANSTVGTLNVAAEDAKKKEEVDVRNQGDQMVYQTEKTLEEMKIECESAELQRIPNTTRSLDADQTRKILKIVDMLEEDDDVTNVFHDLEIPEDFEE